MISSNRLKSAVRKRRSTRTYKNCSLSADDKVKLQSYIDEIKTMTGPFSTTFDTLQLIEQSTGKAEKIGTYGFIKHAPAFIVGATKNTKPHLIDYGYLFEMLILELTENNFGTVWLGGTFKRPRFDALIKDDNYFIPAITPVGYKHARHSMREYAIRKIASADSRKDFGDLFFEYPAMVSLKRTDEPRLAKALDMVRGGPSASNKQPWRIYHKKNTLHVYLKKDPKYNAMLKYDIQYLDIGIALCHLEIGLKTHDFSFKRFDEAPNIELDNHEYILSYKIKRLKH